jgi:hypothetical protein
VISAEGHKMARTEEGKGEEESSFFKKKEAKKLWSLSISNAGMAIFDTFT